MSNVSLCKRVNKCCADTRSQVINCTLICINFKFLCRCISWSNLEVNFISRKSRNTICIYEEVMIRKSCLNCNVVSRTQPVRYISLRVSIPSDNCITSCMSSTAICECYCINTLIKLLIVIYISIDSKLCITDRLICIAVQLMHYNLCLIRSIIYRILC